MARSKGQKGRGGDKGVDRPSWIDGMVREGGLGMVSSRKEVESESSSVKAAFPTLMPPK